MILQFALHFPPFLYFCFTRDTENYVYRQFKFIYDHNLDSLLGVWQQLNKMNKKEGCPHTGLELPKAFYWTGKDSISTIPSSSVSNVIPYFRFMQLYAKVWLPLGNFYI